MQHEKLTQPFESSPSSIADFRELIAGVTKIQSLADQRDQIAEEAEAKGIDVYDDNPESDKYFDLQDEIFK